MSSWPVRATEPVMAQVLRTRSRSHSCRRPPEKSVQKPLRSSARNFKTKINSRLSVSAEPSTNGWQIRQFSDKEQTCFICKRVHQTDECKEMIQRKLPLMLIATAENNETNAVSAEEMICNRSKIRKCSVPLCGIQFHENCFMTFREGDFVPEIHVLDNTGSICIDLNSSKKWICPQHECNFCNQELLRTRASKGEFIRCAKCIFAWHRSCVIVGSQHNDRYSDQYVLCPRHNNLKRVSKRNVPYCVECETALKAGTDKVACSLCIRTFCRTCIAKKKRDEELETSNGTYVCDFCRCFDFPRIGDYVLAAYKSSFWPAKTLHADLLPQSLHSNHTLVKRLIEAGHILVQWVEGLQVPNYDVVTCRDLVPVPKTLECAFWKRMKNRENIFQAVKLIYHESAVVFGVRRPLPVEVTEGIPNYVRLKGNINMRLARVKSDGKELGQCNCEVVDGKRCTPAHGCWNRLMMTECPEDCDVHYCQKLHAQAFRANRRGWKAINDSESTNLPLLPMCTNNFLRNHNTDDDNLIMEEKLTTNKGFGVFAKCNIPEGTDLTEYMGRVMTKDEYMWNLCLYGSLNNLETSYYGMRLTNDLYVDARNCGSIGRSFNHSCIPNCKVDIVTVDRHYRLKISTIKDVKKGEELTYDYGTEICDGFVGMKCFCGTEKCRNIIGVKKGTIRKNVDDCDVEEKRHGAVIDGESLRNNALTVKHLIKDDVAGHPMITRNKTVTKKKISKSYTTLLPSTVSKVEKSACGF